MLSCTQELNLGILNHIQIQHLSFFVEPKGGVAESIDQIYHHDQLYFGNSGAQGIKLALTVCQNIFISLYRMEEE